MVLEILTSLVREIISYSWDFAAITTKYYILGVLAFLYTENKFSLEDFTDKLLSDGRLILTGFLIVGILLYLVEISLTPQFVLLSELITLLYLGYLFWMY